MALLAARHGGRLRSGKERALVGDVRIHGQRVALAFPQTYMNDSGMSVRALVRRYGIEDLRSLLIVHDELDLPLGRLQIKDGGGLAGHNGLRSIKEHLHSTTFRRIRIGIGKPAGRKDGADHVLSRPGASEREELAVSVQEAADAVEMIVRDGLAAAMSQVNRKAAAPPG